jgi:hypothetical protein
MLFSTPLRGDSNDDGGVDGGTGVIVAMLGHAVVVQTRPGWGSQVLVRVEGSGESSEIHEIGEVTSAWSC